MAVSIPFNRTLEFTYGAPAQLSPLVRRVIAPNGGPFTFHGTGTYIVGRGRVAVIDPGPDIPAHVEAVLAATRGEEITHLLITHTHRDHSPASQALQSASGARTYGFGPHPTRRAGPQVEEGGDYDFRPDVALRDGDRIEGPGWTFEALHTPGHLSNHLCFALQEEKALFCGDHVMGWSTSVISPPDGDMHAYMAALRKLLPRDDAVYYPTHGSPIGDPQHVVALFIAHREDRERQILDCIAGGIGTIPDMVRVMYRDTDRRLHGAAARSVLAHLIHMAETGRVKTDGAPTEESVYRLP